MIVILQWILAASRHLSFVFLISKIVSIKGCIFHGFVFIPVLCDGLDQCSLLLVMKISNWVFVLMRVGNVWQMTTAIAIEDVRREVKILRALTGHKNLVQFYEAYEDNDNVYIVME